MIDKEAAMLLLNQAKGIFCRANKRAFATCDCDHIHLIAECVHVCSYYLGCSFCLDKYGTQWNPSRSIPDTPEG